MLRTSPHGPGAWRVAKLAGFLRAIGAAPEHVHAAEDAADLIDRYADHQSRCTLWQDLYLDYAADAPGLVS